MKISTLFIASNIFILSAFPVSHAKTFEESPADPTTHAVSQPVAPQSSGPAEITPRIIRVEPKSYIGLAFGRTNFDLTFTDVNIEDKGNIAGIYVGSDLNEWFGFETAIMITGDIASQDVYESQAGFWSFTPTARLQLSDNVNFYIKGGFASTAYILEPDLQGIDYWDWAGWLGTAGAGVRAQFTDFSVRAGIDYLTGTLDANDVGNPDMDVDMMVFTGGIEYRF